MSNKIKWTKEEDNILVQALRANPHNKTKAFKEASLILKRSFSCCQSRWYKALNNPESKVYIGHKGLYSKPEILTSAKKRSLWDKIKALFKF